MKKRIFSMVLALVCCMFLMTPIYAKTDLPRLVDNADLLSSTEESNLMKQLDEISKRQKFDVIIVTTDTLEGKTPKDYADDFYDYNGYGYGNNHDGVLLLISSMEKRDWYITTIGYGITAITDAGRSYISDQVVSDLSDGNYVSGFERYAELCDDFVTQAKNGKPYDTGNMPRGPFPFMRNLLIALLVGLIVGVISVQCMKAKMKTVRVQKSAANYEKEGSMVINESRDMFLYSKIDRRRKPKQNQSSGSSTHKSSSGTTHGGGGGKF